MRNISTDNTSDFRTGTRKSQIEVRLKSELIHKIKYASKYINQGSVPVEMYQFDKLDTFYTFVA